MNLKQLINIGIAWLLLTIPYAVYVTIEKNIPSESFMIFTLGVVLGLIIYNKLSN